MEEHQGGTGHWHGEGGFWSQQEKVLFEEKSVTLKLAGQNEVTLKEVFDSTSEDGKGEQNNIREEAGDSVKEPKDPHDHDHDN